MSHKIINFGSINIDHVYRVDKMPLAGETVSARSYSRFLGGKGVNQSIAIAKAGGQVIHIGAVNENDDWTIDQFEKLGVSCASVEKVAHPTGHAIILVDDNGENQITIFGGANQNLKERQIDQALIDTTSSSDWVLLQTETNLLTEIVDAAKRKGIKVAYAAAPFVEDVAVSLISKIDLLAVNEGEANQLANALGTTVDKIPVSNLLVTKGSQGAFFIQDNKTIVQPAYEVEAVDTTGAGDTFLGSFLAIYVKNNDATEALEYASAASALQVTKQGTGVAIPDQKEVMEFLKSRNT